MATQLLDLTETPQQVTGLTSGTNYVGQNVGVSTVFITAVAGSSQPTGAALEARFEAEPRENITLVPVGGETIWAWCSRPIGRMVWDAQS